MCLSVCVHVGEKVPKGFLEMTVNERGSEEHNATTRTVINLLKAKHFWIHFKKVITVTGNKTFYNETRFVCLAL